MKPLFDGGCAYARSIHATRYEIIVYSSNHVEHVQADLVRSSEHAARICKRLNAYPRQTREYHGLL